MRTPRDAASDAAGRDEGKITTSNTTNAATPRLWPSDESATASETLLLPPRAPRADKYHRPGAPGSLLPACGTFDSTGVEADRDELRERGYRPCQLCWPAGGVDGAGWSG